MAVALMIGSSAMTLTSCINDAPEINATATFTHITDFSGLIAAINNGNANLVVAINENGQLIMDAIDRNGEKVSQTITNGFTQMKAAMGALGDSIYVSSTRNQIAINTLTETTRAGLAELAAKGDQIVLAINDQGQAVALAINNNGQAVAAQLLQTNTRLAALADSISKKGNQLIVAVGENTKATTAAGDSISKAVYTLDKDQQAALKALNDSAVANNGRLVAAIDEQGNAVVAAIKDNADKTDDAIKTLAATILSKTDGYVISNDQTKALLSPAIYSDIINDPEQVETLNELLKETEVSVKLMYSYRKLTNGTWNWTTAGDSTAAQAKLTPGEAALRNCGVEAGQIVFRKIADKGDVTVKVHNTLQYVLGQNIDKEQAIVYTDAAGEHAVTSGKTSETIKVVFWQDKNALSEVTLNAFGWTNNGSFTNTTGQTEGGNAKQFK